MGASDGILACIEICRYFIAYRINNPMDRVELIVNTDIEGGLLMETTTTIIIELQDVVPTTLERYTIIH